VEIKTALSFGGIKNLNSIEFINEIPDSPFLNEREVVSGVLLNILYLLM
jgi:hypothetical protein